MCVSTVRKVHGLPPCLAPLQLSKVGVACSIGARNPLEACVIKVGIIDSMLCSAIAGELIESLFRTWQIMTRSEASARTICAVRAREAEAKNTQEKVQAEARATVDKACERRREIGEKLTELLAAHHSCWILKESFCHWRCVADGFILPCLRKKNTLQQQGSETERNWTFLSSRLRRKSFMWWVTQTREMVIRRMQVESWVLARALEALQAAWHGWNDRRHADHTLVEVDNLVQIYLRRDKLVSTFSDAFHS